MEAVLQLRYAGREAQVKWVGYQRPTWEPVKYDFLGKKPTDWFQAENIPKELIVEAKKRESQGEEYEVEEILGFRETPSKTEYQVKWVGYKKSTWEPVRLSDRHLPLLFLIWTLLFPKASHLSSEIIEEFKRKVDPKVEEILDVRGKRSGRAVEYLVKYKEEKKTVWVKVLRDSYGESILTTQEIWAGKEI